MNQKNNFEDVQPGSYLATRRNVRYALKYIPPLQMHRVARVTAKQIVLEGGDRVWIKDGRKVGHHWESYFIPTTEQIHEQAVLVNRRNHYVGLLDWLDESIIKKRRELTIEQIEAMKSAFEPVVPEQEQ